MPRHQTWPSSEFLFDKVQNFLFSLIDCGGQEGIVDVGPQISVLLPPPVDTLLPLHHALHVLLGEGDREKVQDPPQLLVQSVHQVLVVDDQKRSMEVPHPVHVHVLPVLEFLHHEVLPHLPLVLLELLQTGVADVAAGPSVELGQDAVEWISAQSVSVTRLVTRPALSISPEQQESCLEPSPHSLAPLVGLDSDH